MTKPVARKKATRRTTKARSTKAAAPPSQVTPPAPPASKTVAIETAASERAAVTQAVPDLDRAAEQALASGRVGHALMDEFEAKCHAVRDWHRQTSDELGRQRDALSGFAEQLDVYRQTLDHERLEALEQQVSEREAIASLRADVLAERQTVEAQLKELREERDSLEQIRSAMAEEMSSLETARQQIATQRSLMEQMRRDLDEEWAGLKTLRQTQTRLGEELEAERQRLSRKAYSVTAQQEAHAA